MWKIGGLRNMSGNFADAAWNTDEFWIFTAILYSHSLQPLKKSWSDLKQCFILFSEDACHRYGWRSLDGNALNNSPRGEQHCPICAIKFCLDQAMKWCEKLLWNMLIDSCFSRSLELILTSHTSSTVIEYHVVSLRRDDPVPPQTDFSPLQPPRPAGSANGLRQTSLTPPFQPFDIQI